MALSEMLHAFCRNLLQCMLTSLLTQQQNYYHDKRDKGVRWIK